MVFDVKRIAKFAMLSVTDEEIAVFEKNIKDVIAMLNKLELKMDDNKSLESVLLEDLPTMGYRSDVEEKGMTNEELVKNAPKALAGCIIVPRTID